jgi:hypothetical protein
MLLKKTLLRLRAIAMEVKFFQQRKLKESKKGEKGKGVGMRKEEKVGRGENRVKKLQKFLHTKIVCEFLLISNIWVVIFI